MRRYRPLCTHTRAMTEPRANGPSATAQSMQLRLTTRAFVHDMQKRVRALIHEREEVGFHPASRRNEIDEMKRFVMRALSHKDPSAWLVDGAEWGTTLRVELPFTDSCILSAALCEMGMWGQFLQEWGKTANVEGRLFMTARIGFMWE